MESFKNRCIAKLNSDIEIINNTINGVSTIAIISIILYGSYGRDEGAFYIVQNEIYTYNDYDIIIVAEELLPEILINKIKQELKLKLNIRWIDSSKKPQKNCIH